MTPEWLSLRDQELTLNPDAAGEFDRLRDHLAHHGVPGAAALADLVRRYQAGTLYDDRANVTWMRTAAGPRLIVRVYVKPAAIQG